MIVQGVSTHRVKDIITELCGREFSKWAALRLAEELDEQVQARVDRPLKQEYPFLILDAMQLKVRRQKAVRSTTVMLGKARPPPCDRRSLRRHRSRRTGARRPGRRRSPARPEIRRR